MMAKPHRIQPPEHLGAASSAEQAAGTRSSKLSASPGDQVQPQAHSVQVLEEQAAQNLPRGVNPGIPNEE